MSTFTIDADHNITAYDSPEAAAQSDAALPGKLPEPESTHEFF
jgi:hypothetical protein